MTKEAGYHYLNRQKIDNNFVYNNYFSFEKYLDMQKYNKTFVKKDIPEFSCDVTIIISQCIHKKEYEYTTTDIEKINKSQESFSRCVIDIKNNIIEPGILINRDGSIKSLKKYKISDIKAVYKFVTYHVPTNSFCFKPQDEEIFIQMPDEIFNLDNIKLFLDLEYLGYDSDKDLDMCFTYVLITEDKISNNNDLLTKGKKDELCDRTIKDNIILAQKGNETEEDPA